MHSELVVRVAPTSLEIQQPGTGAGPSHPGAGQGRAAISVLENTNLTLQCQADNGKPPPKVAIQHGMLYSSALPTAQLLWELPEGLPSFSLSESVINGSAVSIISALVVRADSGMQIHNKNKTEPKSQHYRAQKTDFA